MFHYSFSSIALMLLLEKKRARESHTSGNIKQTKKKKTIFFCWFCDSKFIECDLWLNEMISNCWLSTLKICINMERTVLCEINKKQKKTTPITSGKEETKSIRFIRFYVWCFDRKLCFAFFYKNRFRWIFARFHTWCECV